MRLPLALLLATGAAFAQQKFPDYFPLEPGNQWIYRSVNFTTFRTVSVSGTQQLGDRTWSVVVQNADPGTAILLRNDGAGKIYQYDPATKQESVALDFTAASGDTVSTPAHYSGPLGDYDNAFTITRLGSVQGTTETYLPYIGKVAGSSFLLSGSGSLVPPLVENLVYARIATFTVLPTREFGLGLTLDRPVYNLKFGQTDDCQGVIFPGAKPGPDTYAPCAQVRLTLRSSGNDTVRLAFPTQQVYEMELRDAAGTLLWRMSDQKVYAQSTREVVVGPGEVNFVELVPLTSARTVPPSLLPAGVYRLTATLVDAVGSASASVAFTVTR